MDALLAAPLVALLPDASTLAGLGSVLLLAAGLSALLLRGFPALGRVVLGGGGRAGELDGLRGILSLLVILHHCIIFRAYCATGQYEAPAGHFDNLAGEAAVALFFTITAYLYWRRLLAGAPLRWPALLVGRLRRLVPMYVAAVAVLVAIVLAESGFALRVPPGELAAEIGQWLCFDFLPLPDINARPGTYYIEVVVWTLRYEWEFVLCLPLLALFAVGRRPWLLYAAGLLLLALVTSRPVQLYGYFLVGLLVAHLRSLALPGWFGPRVQAWAGLAAVPVLVLGFTDVYGPAQMALLGLVFFGVTSGAGPWAVLRWSPLRFLGLISYGTYLLHHMVLYLVATRLLGPDRFAALDGAELQGVVLAVGAGAVLLATATHLLIERPCLPARAH